MEQPHTLPAGITTPPTRPPTQVDTTAAIPMKVASRDMADLMGEAEGMDIEQRPDAVITAPGN